MFIETCIKYPGGPTRNRGTDIYIYSIYISEHNSSSPLVYTYFYNRARRLRLEKLLYMELPRSSSGYFKPLLDPGLGSGFTSETAARRFQKQKRPLLNRFGSETVTKL